MAMGQLYSNQLRPIIHINLTVARTRRGGVSMLWTIFLILLIAWILGLVGTYQIGAFVWLLLVAALIVLVIQLVTGRRPVV
jgi:hypothetical protein